MKERLISFLVALSLIHPAVVFAKDDNPFQRSRFSTVNKHFAHCKRAFQRLNKNDRVRIAGLLVGLAGAMTLLAFAVYEVLDPYFKERSLENNGRPLWRVRR